MMMNWTILKDKKILKMKKLLLLLTILQIFTFCNGQEKKSGDNSKYTSLSEEHKTIYTDETLKEQGQFDENGKKTGEWKWYHDNGQLWIIENYKNGKRTGESNEYYENGQLMETGSYENGEKTGEWKEYHENGQLKSIEKFTNGKSTGEKKENIIGKDN
ncbi:MORN repeat protein [Sphingobacterium faecium]|nr:MORN repeat protein [Sphingobacterium faecium]